MGWIITVRLASQILLIYLQYRKKPKKHVVNGELHEINIFIF